MWQWDNWNKQERRKLLSGDQKTSALKCKHIIINCSDTVTFHVHAVRVHSSICPSVWQKGRRYINSVDLQKWTSRSGPEFLCSHTMWSQVVQTFSQCVSSSFSHWCWTPEMMHVKTKWKQHVTETAWSGYYTVVIFDICDWSEMDRLTDVMLQDQILWTLQKKFGKSRLPMFCFLYIRYL